MSFLLYLGLFFLSLSWLWMLPLYGEPQRFPFLMIVAGLVLCAVPPRSVRLLPFDKGDTSNSVGRTGAAVPLRPAGAVRLPGGALLLLVPVVLALVLLPRIFAPGLIVIAVALVGGVRWGEGEGTFRPVTGWILAGTVLVAQAAAFPLFAVLSAHVHGVPLFGYMLYPFVKLFAPGAAVSGGRIFLASTEDIYGFSVSLEKLGFVPLAFYGTACIISRMFSGDAIRSLGKMVVTFAGYGALRFIAVFFAVVLSGNERLFWYPLALLLSLILLPPALAWIVPYGPVRKAGERQVEASGGSYFRTVLLWTAAVFLLVGSVLFHDPGVRKRGRVLFDEYYSDWEWSTEVYDRDWYGSKSGYNYYSLFEYIKLHFDATRGHEPFTSASLSPYDVVIVKTPTRTFTEAEIEALERFVHGGGGLYLIGDHTNVFGTSTNLNPLAARFGLRFNYDSTYELHSMALSNYTSPPYLAHPVTVHVPAFFFATSCTMDAPLLGEQVILGNNLKGLFLDYSQRSYFPNKDEREYEFGFLIQMAGVKYGRGRVLGFTDSTVFSNFFMFIPGKPELFLGSLDWLNRSNRWHRLNILFLVLGIAAAVAGGRMLKRVHRFGAWATLLTALAIGLVCSLHLFDTLKRSSYPPVEPKGEVKGIAFESSHSRNDMPLRRLVRNREASLHTFYVWTQRLGFFPSLHPTLESALRSSDIAVVANPVRSLSVDQIDAVVDFVRHGGNLLLIVDPANRRSTAREFLGIFRMRAGTAVADTTEILNTKGERICTGFKVGGIQGGIPLLTTPSGEVVFVYDTLGRGRFFAFGGFYTFSQEVMGPTSVTPNRHQREVFELEYQILEILSGERRPPDIKPYLQAEEPAG